MKPSLIGWLVVTLAACACAGDVYKILVVFPMPGKSHSILGDGVVRHLAAAGHQITYITPLPKKTQPPNVRQIDVSANFKLMKTELLSIKGIMDRKASLGIVEVATMMQLIHNGTFYEPSVQALLQNPQEQFDIIIAEWMFSELYAGFSAIFGAPFVWVSTVEPHWMALQLIDERLNPAYSADTMSANIPPFSFFERVQQLGLQVAGTVLSYLFTGSAEAQIYQSLAPFAKLRGRELPDFDVIRYNASLMLGNSHVSLGQATTLPQSYKAIGGYHIDTNLAPLPADLQKLLDNAKHGLIYFSMGSNLKSKDMPDELKRDLIAMFGTLKQTVLWKFEEVLPNLPKNVHIISWAPQPSILAHPNCVMFITHGGLLSTTETIHFAKPIIGVPVFADQFLNVERAVKKGFARRVDLSYGMTGELKAAIEEILANPSYANKVKELSFIYHDRPVPPGRELVHWVEHVVRTRGAPHLRSPALDTPFYQKMYLDLAALILAAGFLIRKVFRSIFKKSSNKVKTN